MVLLLMISFVLFHTFQKPWVRWINHLINSRLKHANYFYIKKAYFVLLREKICWEKAVLKIKSLHIFRVVFKTPFCFVSEDKPVIQAKLLGFASLID